MTPQTGQVDQFVALREKEVGMAVVHRVALPPPCWMMLSKYFGLNPDQQDRVWGAIARAKWSVASSWRQTVLLLDSRGPSPDTVGVFLREHSPPSRVMAVLESLVQEKLLSRREVSAVEEKVLAQVSADGQWK
jgi:hypothetical protein